MTDAVKKIDAKIASVSVLKEDGDQAAPEAAPAAPEAPQKEKISDIKKRPVELRGVTYQIKSPTESHSMMVTINNAVLNAGTEDEEERPYEILLLSKEMNNFQWIAALSSLVTRMFRMGVDTDMLIEDLEEVFDPRGGYLKKGKYMPSLVAEIGSIIKNHLANECGVKKELDEHLAKAIEEKKQAYVEEHGVDDRPRLECPECGEHTLVVSGGCPTCESCGYSKCG